MKKAILVLFIIATVVFALQIWMYVSRREILPFLISCGWWVSSVILYWLAYKQKPNN